MANPIKKYNIEQMIDQDNKPVEGLYVVTLSKKLSRIGPDVFNSYIDSLGGIDAIEPIGMYTVRLRVAKTFDASEVIAELGQGLETLQSDLTLPSPAGKTIKFPGNKN